MNNPDNHHDEQKNLSRRKFLRLGASGAALAGLGALAGNTLGADPSVAGNSTPPQTPGTAAAPAQPQAATGQITGKLPLRPYGRTGLNISAIVGASDWSPAVIPLAVQAGVNYWHKANSWKTGVPDAIKSQPRESYYLECVLDRSGYLYGPIEEDKFYAFCKASIGQLRIGYFDVLKFHYGYNSIDEAKTQLGVVNAFQRLKKEGLVKHLALSQHHFNGNAKQPGGQTAYEILPWIMDNLPYEAAQFFCSYSGNSGRGPSPVKDVLTLIDTCKQKNFGSIAMKTMSGVGRAATDKNFQAMLADPKYKGSTPGAAVVKWLMSNPNLCAATIATASFDQLTENCNAAIHPTLTHNDFHTLELLTAFNKGTTCLLCADCATSCPEEIAIVDILRYERYAMDYHDLSRAKAEYKTLTKNGTACLACGDCMPASACPADINIISKLKEVHDLLG